MNDEFKVVIRLEYYEEDGTLHFGETDEDNKNTFGYRTIYPHLELYIATKFKDWYHEKYPSIWDEEGNWYPSYEEAVAVFNEYCKTNGL